MTDTMSRLREAHALVDRCTRLAEHAREEGRPDQAQRAEELGEHIWATIDLSDAKWREPFVEDLLDIRKKIQEPPKRTKTRAAQEESRKEFGALLGGYPLPDFRSTSPGDDVPVPDVSADVRKVITAGDRRFALVSGVVVVIAGLTALYFNDDTFGTVGDYMAILVWGATVQQGINLLRRVWASRVTQLSV